MQPELPDNTKNEFQTAITMKNKKNWEFFGTQKVIVIECPKTLTVLFYNPVKHPKDADGMANSAESDQTAPWSSLIRVCTIFSDLSE